MKIYHLCPSGAVWIFNEKEVPSREAGEALFNKVAATGDVLKIDIPGQDTIKITKILNIKNSMSKKSQFKEQVKEIKKTDEQIRKEKEADARLFFEKYTALTKETGFFINAVLEITEDGIKPKIAIALLRDNEDKTKTPPAPEAPKPEPEPAPVK